MSGPRYLFVGSRLTDDTLVLRLFLDGLNSQARKWSEQITILDNGSLDNLENEVDGHSALAYRRVEGWPEPKPNIVIAFMDRLSHNRDTEMLLIAAYRCGVPTFVMSNYAAGKLLP